MMVETWLPYVRLLHPEGQSFTGRVPQIPWESNSKLMEWAALGSKQATCPINSCSVVYGTRMACFHPRASWDVEVPCTAVMMLTTWKELLVYAGPRWWIRWISFPIITLRRLGLILSRLPPCTEYPVSCRAGHCVCLCVCLSKCLWELFTSCQCPVK